MKKPLAILLAVCTLVCAFSIGVTAAEKVFALTMGVHQYSVNSTVSDGSDIASVIYTRHKTGAIGSANRIYDIQNGEQFTLTTAVKEGQETYYAFIGWLDADGAVISTEPTLELTMDSSKTAIAAYSEIADRHVLTYSVAGEGSVSVSSDHKLYEGEGCVSILHGASASIKMTPAKNHSIFYLKVNGQKVGFLQNAVSALRDAAQSGNFKNILNALVNVVKFCLGKDAVYTIPSVEADTTFEVGFLKPYFEKK